MFDKTGITSLLTIPAHDALGSRADDRQRSLERSSAVILGLPSQLTCGPLS
jgi:hypothetical protein